LRTYARRPSLDRGIKRALFSTGRWYSSFRAVVRSRTLVWQAHTPPRRLLPLAAIATVVLVLPALGLAGSSRGGPHRAASTLRAANAHLAAKSRSAVLQLYSLDERLGAAQSSLAQLQQEAASLRAEQASLSQQLLVARQGSRIAQKHVAKRLLALYEQGNVEPLEILFGAKSLDDAITSIDNLNRVAGQSEDVLRQLRAARSALTAASARLAARRAALEAKTRMAVATAASLEQTRTDRSAYLASLAHQRRLNDTQIARLIAEAQAAQAKSSALAHQRSSFISTSYRVSTDVATPAVAGRTITVSATGYSLSGTTATGLPVGYGVAAVDPSVIPLGTHMSIPGYGEAVAADTGGSVVGATIDLWFPSEALANAWGRRSVTIVLH
jgi:3D (Asp-Asp-Asp) domain-containing protein